MTLGGRTSTDSETADTLDRRLLGRILPPEVCYAEAYHDTDDGSTLFTSEKALLARAGSGAKRRREFTTVRACARAALGQLGVAPAPILPGPGRAPRWPAGVTGSITHCAGYRAAAVARTERVLSLGIDAEPARPLPAGLPAVVGSPAEIRQLEALTSTRPDVPWDRLLFCAKEATYKAWYPLTRRWIGLTDITVELRTDGGLTAWPPPVGPATDRPDADHPPVVPPRQFDGRWVTRDGLLLVAVTVPSASASD